MQKAISEMHLLSCFIWEETRRLFWHSCEKKRGFFFAFCDEKNDVLVFELFTRKGIFLLISWRHSFCVVVFFSILNWPVQNMMWLCLFTVFHACICTYIFLLAIYKDVCLQEPQTFFSLEHPRVRLYECFFSPPFFEKNGKKQGVLMRDVLFCFVFVLWHRRKYFSVDNLSYA